jgi:hypothetical protein
VTPAAFRKLALSMPGAVELPHFDRASFRAGKKKKKRIFATMTSDGSEAMVRVQPPAECFDLIEAHPKTFFSYGGFTERNGSLGVRLARVDAKLIRELVRDAWESVGPH